MVQRLVGSGEQLDLKNTASGCWRSISQQRIGDLVMQFANGEARMPLHGLPLQRQQSHTQRRGFEEDLEPLPNSNKRFKHGGIDGSVGYSRAFKLASAHAIHQPLEEPSPLGLTLKKTPSFLDLVAMTVGQGCGNSDNLVLAADGSRAGLPSSCSSQKLKASNFSASKLHIGAWERASKYEGDVVAKCYYAKRKLVWEVLEGGLKSKIELQWSDICAIRASYGEGQLGVLEVEVSRPPLFFKETNPQPRKHTLWEATSDFTGGEATICKRHSLQFAEGVLNKHYEKLLQCDSRLKSLAGVCDPVDKVEESTAAEDKERSKPPPLPQQPQLCCKVKEELQYSPLENSRRSPSSVMDVRGSEDSDGEECGPEGVVKFGRPQSRSSSEDASGVDIQEQKPPCSLFLLTRDLSTSDKDVLNEIAQLLLGENSASKASSERGGLIRVSSMTGIFGEDGGPWLPTSYAVSDWSLAEGYDNGRSSAGESVFELEEKPRVLPDQLLKHEPHDGLHQRQHEQQQQQQQQPQQQQRQEQDDRQREQGCGFLKQSKRDQHGSTGDLLVNLPRIASLPQLFVEQQRQRQQQQQQQKRGS